MTDSWKDGYRRAMLAYLVKHGTPVSPRASEFGWIHPDWNGIQEHVRECGWRVDSEITEDEWNEFAGTFYEGDTDHHGVTAIVSCHCVLVEKVPYRLEGTFSEITMGMLQEPDEG